MYPRQSALIETDALRKILYQPGLKILDASYHIPPSPRQARLEYEQARIPGALFFDIDAIADPDTSLPHMLPAPDDFERHMHALGIGSGDTVVVYDVHGMMSAPRAWWMFRYFGHQEVYVLNGGLPKWLDENHPVQTGLADATGQSAQTPAFSASFQARVNPQLLCSLNMLKQAVDKASETGSSALPLQVVDMRSEARFKGESPEPRAGLKSGHIPGSLNAPWGTWLNPDQTLLSPADLQARCAQLKLNEQSSIVMTCGSGITACVGALALYESGNASVAVYDGAWAEWGALQELPVEV